MNKRVKSIFTIVAVICLILGLTVVIVPMLFDPNDYKDEIKNAVNSATGRILQIDGNLSLSIFPWLGIETGELSLSNAAGFNEEPIAQIEQAEIKIKLLPLFSKQIRVNQIVLKGLQLNLAKNARGQFNWDFDRVSVTDKHVEPKAVKKADTTNASAMPRLSIANLAIEKVTIENAKINWTDQNTQNNVRAENLNFHMNKFRFNEAIDFKISSIIESQAPIPKHDLSITGRLTVADNLNHYQLERIYMVAESDPGIDNENPIQSELTANTTLDLSEHTFSVSKLDLKIDHLQIHSIFSGHGIDRTPTIEGSMTIETFNPRELAKRLGQTLPESAPPSVLNKMNGRFDFTHSKSTTEFANIVAQLDDTEIRGAASIDQSKSTAIKFNIEADQLDADRYIPANQQSSKSTADSTDNDQTDTKTGSNTPTNRDADPSKSSPPDPNVEGVINIGDLHVRNIKAQGLQIVVNAKNRIVRTNQRIKNLYDGHYQGAMELNLQGAVPTLSFNEKFSKIALGALLTDLNGKAKITGITNATIQLTARGSNPESIKSSLNGNAEATIRNGYISGVDMVKIIRDARTLLKPNAGQFGQSTDQTKFSEMRISATITDGLVKTRMLHAKSQALEIDGGGTIYLVNDAVDLDIDATISDDPEGLEGIKIKELQGVTIPIKVDGTLSKLKYTPDLRGILKNPQIQKAKDKLKKKLGGKIAPEVENLLDRLF